MTVPTIPENAPFSPAQRAWLNGFFAGLISSGQACSANGNGATAPTMATPSNEDLPADGAGGAPAEAGGATSWHDVEDDDPDQYPWHDPDMSLEDRMQLVEDQPLDLKLMGAMAQLDCGQCGYLCRTYSKAIETGEETDLKRCAPDGKPTAKMLKKILSEQGGSNGDGEGGSGGESGGGPKADAPSSSDAAASRTGQLAGNVAGAAGHLPHDRDNPFPAPTLAVERLTARESNKDTRFVSLSLAGSGLEYKVGDSLGVYPRNCYEEVDALVRMARAGGGEPITLAHGRHTTFREALIDRCDIQNPSDELFELLADCTADEQEAADLKRALDEEAVEGLIDEPRVLDVLARFPGARPSPADLVAALDKLQPRLYSIASSPKMHPGEVHLTVGVVRYEQHGEPRKGVASTFLADRVINHEPIHVFIQPSHGFTITDDHGAPVIMVGPGTGIAPFRAFLEERKATGATGRNWLFFGEQHAATEFLYEDELNAWREEGLLTRLSTAFSRDQSKRLYVQHRMLENAADLWAWLEDGAYFYVCGDAARMAGDVDRALHRIVAEQGGRSEDDARAYIAEMKKAGRYQRDVY